MGRKALTLVAALALSTTALVSMPAQAATDYVVDFEAGAFSPIPFGGESALIVTDAPAGFNGTKALKITSGNQVWSGTTIASDANYSFISLGKVVVTGRVKAPAAGKPVMLKIENIQNDKLFKEATATTTGTGWETLTWTFSGLVDGVIYNKASIFSDFGTVSTGDIYYYDDIVFPAISNAVTIRTATPTLVTFEQNDNTGFLETGFEGASAELAAVPAGGNGGTGLKIVRNGGQVYAGVAVLDAFNGTVKYTSSANKIVTMNFHSTKAVPVMLQLKVGTDIVEQKVNAPAGWSVLSFDFGATLFSGVYGNDKEYIQVFLFPHFGTVGAGEIFFVDNIAFNGATTPSIPVAPPVKTSQTIAKSIATLRVGKMATLPLKTNKKLAVRWVSKTPAICSVTSGKVKGKKVGVCKVVGTNAGNASFKAVTAARSIKITK
jgi:hypothetical protein